MSEKKALFYNCGKCKINFKTKRCPRCDRNGTPVYNVPFTRDFSTDPTYLDYVLKNKADKKQLQSSDE